MPSDSSPIRRGAQPDTPSETAQAPRRSALRNPDASGGGIGNVNRMLRREGDSGRAGGGLWGRAEQRMASGQETNPGSSLGTQVDGAALFTKGGGGGDMNVSTETAAAVVQQQGQEGSAPIAPTPMVAPGIHEDGMTRPYVPFSPPPARVTSSMATTPKVSLQGADTAGVDTLAAGQHLAHNLQTLGDAQVGVMTADVGHSNRLDLMIDREMRAESRLHNG